MQRKTSPTTKKLPCDFWHLFLVLKSKVAWYSTGLMFYSGLLQLDDQQTPGMSPTTIMSASWTVKGIYFIITEHHRSNFWQWQEDKPQRTPSLELIFLSIVPTQFPSAVAEVANCPSVSILPPFPFNIKALQVLAWAGSQLEHSISSLTAGSPHDCMNWPAMQQVNYESI